MTSAEFETWLRDNDRRPLVMGVLNITPDSFSDGGHFDSVDVARRYAESMAEAGVDLIDIGGESTRPGAERVVADEQIRRVVPVLRACRDLDLCLSIDTTLSAVAQAALDAGASVINDISAGRDDPAIAGCAARRQCSVILMHMLGEPGTMQANPTYSDVVAEVAAFLDERARWFESVGVAPHRILVDPGIGFGKTIEHNLDLLAATERFVKTHRPVLVGVSRKGFIGKLTNKADPSDRIFGTAAAVAWCVAQGAAIVRVHDVAAMKDVVTIAHAIGRRALR